jgi:hypothetical protein
MGTESKRQAEEKYRLSRYEFGEISARSVLQELAAEYASGNRIIEVNSTRGGEAVTIIWAEAKTGSCANEN